MSRERLRRDRVGGEARKIATLGHELLDLVLDGATDQDHVLAVDGRGRIRPLEGLHREGLEALVVEVEDGGLVVAVLGDVGPHLLLLAADLDRRRPRHLRPATDRLDGERDALEGGDGALAERVQEVDRVHEEQVAVLVHDRLVAVDGVALHLLPDALDGVLPVRTLLVEEDAILAVELGVAERRELHVAGRLVLGVDAIGDLVGRVVVDQVTDIRSVELRSHDHRTVGIGKDHDVHQLGAASLRPLLGVEDEGDLAVLGADGVARQVAGIAGLREEDVRLGLEALGEGSEQEGQHWGLPWLGPKNRLRAGLPRIPTGNATAGQNMHEIPNSVKD